MPDPFSRTILHIDMDAYFASIEQRDNPLLRGKPVIVGARPGTRGVVSAASYEARKFGVHSAMPISEAVRCCPQGEFVRPRMNEYEETSQRIMNMARDVSPLVEQISVDEAFIDITGTGRLHGTPEHTAQELMKRIVAEEKITASIGIAPNKFLAKLASDCNKPAGLTVAPRTEPAIIAWLAPMPIQSIWGVGSKTAAVFGRYSVRTIGDLQAMKIEMLTGIFGDEGWHFYDLCRGRDERPVASSGAPKSVSRETTFEHDCGDVRIWKQTLHELCADVARSCRRQALRGQTVFLTFRTADFTRATRQRKMAEPVCTADPIYKTVCSLLDKEVFPGNVLRLIGAGVSDFVNEAQLSLFDSEAAQKSEHSASAMDALCRKFGDKAVRLGREIT